eukprot:CAMPEP_0178993764 /NCGR_PEP_ID=MMETSP0795-20121207/6888_1 /TAXON_ID=88552 /ORGANISM="Amoebophrya sp., Strain Ameob2" /LENGTH=558 /DNA_ID=CAMNT_0020685867 /DNA_START=122 /DNA_END=1797 /DNA_ORIENTATION=-
MNTPPFYKLSAAPAGAAAVLPQPRHAPPFYKLPTPPGAPTAPSPGLAATGKGAQPVPWPNPAEYPVAKAELLVGTGPAMSSRSHPQTQSQMQPWPRPSAEDLVHVLSKPGLTAPPNLLAQWTNGGTHLTRFNYNAQPGGPGSSFVGGGSAAAGGVALVGSALSPGQGDSSSAAGPGEELAAMQAQGVGVEPIPVAAEKGGEKESGGEGGAGDEGTILIDLYDYGSKAKIGISKNKRPEQQDAFFIFQDGEEHYFGVIDGHGPEGGWVADVLQNKLPEFLRASGDMREAFAKTEDFLGQDPRSYCSGAAIAVCHVNAKEIECWHLGDCRILYGDVCLTADHSVKNLTFQERMTLSRTTGARFLANNTRVTVVGGPGSLELVRCFGDRWGKECNLFSAVPAFCRVERRVGPAGAVADPTTDPPKNQREPDILLASDGVWGVLSNEEALREADACAREAKMACGKAGSAAGSLNKGAAAVSGPNPVERIMRRAIETGSTDNITCINIFTRKLRPKKQPVAAVPKDHHLQGAKVSGKAWSPSVQGAGKQRVGGAVGGRSKKY